MTPAEFIPALATELLKRGHGIYVGTILRSNGYVAVRVRQKAYDAYKASKARSHDRKMARAVDVFLRECSEELKGVAMQMLANVAGLKGVAPPTDEQATPIVTKVEQLGGFPDGKKHP